MHRAALPSVRIHKRNLLKPRVVIASYNDHCSAPFSRALVGWHHQSLLGRGSRHCYGINYLNNPVRNCSAIESPNARSPEDQSRKIERGTVHYGTIRRVFDVRTSDRKSREVLE